MTIPIPKEAIEAAARCIAGGSVFDEEQRLDMAFAALTAALPHLAQPSKSDEALEALIQDCAHGKYDGQNGTFAAINRGNAILTAVRAEERERAVKIWEDTEPSCQHLIPAAIRARKP